MRLFLSIILLTFLCSSYSNAASAFDKNSCCPDKYQQAMSLDDSSAPDDNDELKPENCCSSEFGDGCGDCCVSHLGLTLNTAEIIQSYKHATNPLPLKQFTGDIVLSFLRPPQKNI